MTFKNSRFSYEAPGLSRTLWYIIRYPQTGREKSRAWITDHAHGKRFQLLEDEELMMSVLWENMQAVLPRGSLLVMLARKAWTPEKVVPIRDHVLATISDKRRGDSAEWERLRAMQPDEWIEWLTEELSR